MSRKYFPTRSTSDTSVRKGMCCRAILLLCLGWCSNALTIAQFSPRGTESLELQLRLGLACKFTFCVNYISTKPTALSSCVTVTLQEVVEWGFKFKDPSMVLYCSHCLQKRKWLQIHLARRNSNKRVSLSFKWRGSCSLGVMRYGYYANDFQFNSHLADFRFFFFTSFQV